MKPETETIKAGDLIKYESFGIWKTSKVSKVSKGNILLLDNNRWIFKESAVKINPIDVAK